MHVLFELTRRAMAVLGGVDTGEIQIGEHHKPVFVALLENVNVLHQLVAVASAEVHHDSEIDAVHVRNQLVHLLRRESVLVIVHIDERITRTRKDVLRDHQR